MLGVLPGVVGLERSKLVSACTGGVRPFTDGCPLASLATGGTENPKKIGLFLGWSRTTADLGGFPQQAALVRRSLHAPEKRCQCWAVSGRVMVMASSRKLPADVSGGECAHEWVEFVGESGLRVWRCKVCDIRKVNNPRRATE